MTTINLHQNPEDLQSKTSSNFANSGFFFSLSILVVTLIALFVLKYYVASIVSQNNALADTVSQQNQSLAGVSNLQRILDMQTRIAQMKSNLQITNGAVGQLKMTEVLDHLGSDLSSGVVVSSYSYDNTGKVRVTFDANNFNEIARQILNFKKSTYFSDASLGNVVRGASNISADMTMNLKM